MEMIIEKVGNVTVVVLPGEQLDASNAKEFKHDIAPVLGASSQVRICSYIEVQDEQRNTRQHSEKSFVLSPVEAHTPLGQCQESCRVRIIPI